MASRGPDTAPPRRQSPAFCPSEGCVCDPFTPAPGCSGRARPGPVSLQPPPAALGGAVSGPWEGTQGPGGVAVVRGLAVNRCPGCGPSAQGLREPAAAAAPAGRTRSDSCELLAHQPPHARGAWAHQPLRMRGPQGPSASGLCPTPHPLLATGCSFAPGLLPSAGASHSRSQQEPWEERGQHLPQTACSSGAGLKDPPINNGTEDSPGKGESYQSCFPFCPGHQAARHRIWDPPQGCSACFPHPPRWPVALGVGRDWPAGPRPSPHCPAPGVSPAGPLRSRGSCGPGVGWPGVQTGTFAALEAEPERRQDGLAGPVNKPEVF